MAENKEPLTSTYDAFGAARGVGDDETWAFGVSWKLMMDDVDVDLVREGLEEAVAVVRESQESPTDLFGPPADYADELYHRWADEGRLHLAGRGTLTWRDVPSAGLAWSAFFCLTFAAVWAAQGEMSRTWTLGMVLIPVGLGLGTAAGLALYEAVLQRRGTLSGVVSGMAGVAAIAAVLAGANEWSKAHPLGTHSVWWYVPVAAVCALLSTSWRRWADTWPTAAPPDDLDTDEWSRRLAALLRERHSLSDTRVATILAEAQGHAAASGRSVQEEFGTPQEYAARFRPDLARRSRLKASFYVLLCALNAIWLLEGFDWTNVVAAVLAAWLAWLAWRELGRYRGLRDE